MVNVLLPEGVTFNLGGNASYALAPDELTLTPNARDQSGAALSITRIDLRQNFNISFDIFLGNNDFDGADGVGFVLHNSPDGVNAIGAGGSGGCFRCAKQQGLVRRPSCASE